MIELYITAMAVVIIRNEGGGTDTPGKTKQKPNSRRKMEMARNVARKGLDAYANTSWELKTSSAGGGWWVVVWYGLFVSVVCN